MAVKVVHITTVPMSLSFLEGQAAFMARRGLEFYAITSPGEFATVFAKSEGVPVELVPMSRRLSPLADGIALVRLCDHIRRMRPTIVHAHTPKAGLLGMLAALLTRTPVRIYHMRGLVFTGSSGWRRALMKAAERLTCMLAHRVLCVSHSLHEVAVAQRLCRAQKITVPAGGSGQGVDWAVRFNPEFTGPEARDRVRRQVGIPLHGLMIGFVGRVVRQKGIAELAAAWRGLRTDYPDLHLLIVGPWEVEDPVPQDIRAFLEADKRVHLWGADRNTARLYAAMDLVVLPSYREGFPNVVLEAGAMERPVVATRIAGCVDAVQHAVTGTLVPPYDAVALELAIRDYLEDPALRVRHGIAARNRVMCHFDRERIWRAVHEEYQVLLRSRHVASPDRP